MPNISVKAPALVDCPYCHARAKFLPSSEDVYRGRDFGPIYVCTNRLTNCDAYVGAHRSTLQPMGILANAPLRALKMRVHTVFDPLHRDLHAAYPDMPVVPRYLYKRARTRAYRWLAHHMGMTQDACHIGNFNEAGCLKAIELIESMKADSGTIREWNDKFDKEPT